MFIYIFLIMRRRVLPPRPECLPYGFIEYHVLFITYAYLQFHRPALY